MTDNELLLALSSLIDEKIKAGYAELKEELKKELKEEIRSLGKEVRRNSITIENDVLPRLQTIENAIHRPV